MVKKGSAVIGGEAQLTLFGGHRGLGGESEEARLAALQQKRGWFCNLVQILEY